MLRMPLVRTKKKKKKHRDDGGTQENCERCTVSDCAFAVAFCSVVLLVCRPGWDDCVAYDLLLTSRFLRKLLIFEKGDHFYKEGLQHRATSKLYRRAQARTFVLWMQTDAAANKWPTSEEKIEEFKTAFMQQR